MTARRGFLINLREVECSEVPDDVEIVHDVSAADVLVAVGTRTGSTGRRRPFPT